MPYPWGERAWVIDTKKRLYGCNMVYSVVYLNKSFHFELLRWPSFWGKWGRQLRWRRLLSLNWHGRWQQIKWKQNVCCSSVWPPWYWRFRTLVLGVPCWLCCSTWEEGKLLPSLCWSNHKLSQGQQAHNAEVLQQKPTLTIPSAAVLQLIETAQNYVRLNEYELIANSVCI